MKALYEELKLVYFVLMVLHDVSNMSRNSPAESYRKLLQTALARDVMTISTVAECHFCSCLFTRQTSY